MNINNLSIDKLSIDKLSHINSQQERIYKYAESRYTKLILDMMKESNFLTKFTDIGESKLEGGKKLSISFTDQSAMVRDEFNLRITAGMIFPAEVRSVKFGGEEYNRIGKKGEFFNDKNERLFVFDKTQLEVGKMGSIVEKTETEKLVKAKREYKEYAKYENILKRAIEKNIDIKLFVAVLEARTEDFSLENINKSLIYLEAISREIAKVPGYNKTNFYDIARTLSVVLPASYDEVLKNRFKFDEKKISFFTKDRKVQKHKDKELPADYSDPAEYSEGVLIVNKMTYCSQTAKNHIKKFVDKGRIKIEPETMLVTGSAKASFDKYNILHKIQKPDFTNISDNIIAGDLFLDASEKHKKFGHRVFVYRKGEEWYVKDPYYGRKISKFMGKETDPREPINLKYYLQYMKEDQKRDIWGVHFFEKKEEGKKEKQQN